MSEYEISLYRIIGEMIRDIRTSKGITLEQVAEQLGVIPKTLQRYEKGERKIKINTIMELSRILSFDYDRFMAEAKSRLAGEDTLTVKETPGYYINDEARRIAQEIFQDEDMKLLFDVKRSVKGKELINYAKFLKEQYERENRL